MKFSFADPELKVLYEAGSGRLARRFPSEVVRAFFRVMLVIASVGDASELRRFRGPRYHVLRGERAGQIALRLNDQYRLIVALPKDGLRIIEITDYH